MNKTRAASPITSWRFERAARFGAGSHVIPSGLAGPDPSRVSMAKTVAKNLVGGDENVSTFRGRGN